MRSAAVRYVTLWPAVTAACPSAIRVWDVPVPAGPIRARFSFAAIYSRQVRYAQVGAGIEEAVCSDSSIVASSRDQGPGGTVPRPCITRGRHAC